MKRLTLDTFRYSIHWSAGERWKIRTFKNPGRAVAFWANLGDACEAEFCVGHLLNHRISKASVLASAAGANTKKCGKALTNITNSLMRAAIDHHA